MKIQELITALPLVLMAAPICALAIVVAPVVLNRSWRAPESKSDRRARM